MPQPVLWYGSGSRISNESVSVSGSESYPDPGFWWQKFKKKKKIRLKFFMIFFWSKFTIYLSLGLHKERPSYRWSLQLSKEIIHHFKEWKLSIFFSFLEGSFLPSWIRIQIRIRIRIHNTGSNCSVIWLFYLCPDCIPLWHRFAQCRPVLVLPFSVFSVIKGKNLIIKLYIQ